MQRRVAANKKHEKSLSPTVGAVVSARPERNKIQALGGAVKARRQRTGRVAIRVILVACRHKELDRDDSVNFSLKPIRDAIANSLGLDDNDARIKFHYGQVVTTGEQGVLVRIEL